MHLNQALDELSDSQLNATLAVAIAAHVLPLFTANYPKDHRPRRALTATQRYLTAPTHTNRKNVISTVDQVGRSTRQAATESEQAHEAELLTLAASLEASEAAAMAVVRASQTVLKLGQLNSNEAGYTAQWAHVAAIRSTPGPPEVAATAETAWQVSTLITLAYPALDTQTAAAIAALFEEFDSSLADLVSAVSAACQLPFPAPTALLIP